jgi:cellulose synthase/poly-beta-1,6-N-acetylglucosamine synthase-like glycosyltransferase
MTGFAAFYLAACAVYVLLDLQLLRGLKSLARKRTRALPFPAPPPFITVLIAARDEEHNLPRVLDALLAQDYPRERMQVVVANDRSVDGTEAVLREYAARFPSLLEHVSIATLPPGWAPKKHALLRGLERARGEWIAVTDADSEMAPGWLSALSREFRDDTGMVLGFTAYAEDRGPKRGLAGGVRALEFSSHCITGAALVGLGFPVIANANNLAYRRRAFDEAGAFERHGRVVSGDDDFTLQEIHATGKWRVGFCTAPEALMRTAAPESWRPFWEQRKRWGGKCIHYRPPQVAFLLGVFAFYLSIPLLLLGGLADGRLGWLGLAGLLLKTGADFLVMRAGLRLFGLSPLLRFFPLTALLHIPLILGAVMMGTLRGFTWKGQKLGTRVKRAAGGRR